MSYLARLKQLDQKTKFSQPPETVPTELTQPGFVSFVGSIWHTNKKIHATNDDRRFCKQCQNLKGRICGVAGPGKLVSARQGYQPILDVPHRCSGYHPNAKDFDQRTGGERWPQVI